MTRTTRRYLAARLSRMGGGKGKWNRWIRFKAGFYAAFGERAVSMIIRDAKREMLTAQRRESASFLRTVIRISRHPATVRSAQRQLDQLEGIAPRIRPANLSQPASNSPALPASA
jgi:hypothetical protein